jgi:TPR repeat protein
MYDKGEGVARDYAKAISWYTMAAEQGDEKAQSSLAVMYGEGKGVERDDKLAYAWSSLSASSGNRRAARNRDILEERLSPRELSEAKEMATRLQAQIERKKNAPEPDPAAVDNSQ